MRRTLIIAAILLLAATICSAADNKPTEFKEGFKALDRKKWEQAVVLMRQALEKSPEEDGRRTRIYGSRFERYYPQYYLGDALYELGCYPEALAAFEESLKAGAIKGRDLENLLTLRDKCLENIRQDREPPDPQACSNQVFE